MEDSTAIATTPVTTPQTTPSVDAPSEEHGPELTPAVEAAIAAAERLIAAPVTIEALLARAAEVFTYPRKHSPTSQLDSKRTSTRPMCQGCSFGIRKETTPTDLEGLLYHPNCAKAVLDPAFVMKTSPRYLAAAIPLTAPRAATARSAAALADATPEEADSSEEDTSVEAPAPVAEAVEDSTTDQVEAAVTKSRSRSRKESAA